MIYAVFLCDKQWKIKKVRQCCPELTVTEGEFLTDLVLEKDRLTQETAEQCILELTLPACREPLSAVIHSYKEAMRILRPSERSIRHIRSGRKTVFSGCFTMNTT